MSGLIQEYYRLFYWPELWLHAYTPGHTVRKKAWNHYHDQVVYERKWQPFTSGGYTTLLEGHEPVRMKEFSL